MIAERESRQVCCTAMEDATILPELTLIRVGEIALRCLQGDISDADAISDIIGILEIGGAPFPRTAEEAQRIRGGLQI